MKRRTLTAISPSAQPIAGVSSVASSSPSTLQMSMIIPPCSRRVPAPRGLLQRTPLQAPTSEPPVAATDADNDTLSYTLGGTNAASFYIVGTSGQLRRGAATLDYETKSSYSVTVNVSDGNGGSDSIAVTINITDVDETPANRRADLHGGHQYYAHCCGEHRFRYPRRKCGWLRLLHITPH